MPGVETNEVEISPHPKPSRLKRVFVIALPVFVLVIGFFGFSLMGKLKPKPQTKSEPPKAAPVVIVPAISDNLVLNIESQGEVRPREEINIASQVGGKIVYISPNFIEGGQFHKGEALVKIESADYDLELTRAEANVAQAQTALTREESEAEIARRDWEDLGEGTASALTLRKPQLAEAKARLLAAKAALAQAQLQQSRTVLRAPFEGRVRTRSVSAGEYITPGQILGRAYDVSVFEIKLPLTDTDLSRMGVGIGFKHTAKNAAPVVDLSANVAGNLHHWQAKLVRVDSAYDSSTRTVFGFAERTDPYGKGADQGVPLAAGLFVNASIAGKDVQSAVIIPRAALRGKDKVFVANDDKTLSIKTVKVAASTKRQAVITLGLLPGENVITSPVRGVAEGMKIEPTNKASTDAEAVVHQE